MWFVPKSAEKRLLYNALRRKIGRLQRLLNMDDQPSRTKVKLMLQGARAQLRLLLWDDKL